MNANGTEVTAWRQQLLWGVVFLVGLAPILFAWRVHHTLSYDDAYVTLTYARNIALGNGFVYNGGEPYLGTTSPLLAMVLGGVGALFRYYDMPTLALWTGAFSWAGAVILAFLLGRRILSPAAGAFMAILIATMPLFIHLLRAEYPLLIFLSFLALWLTTIQRYWLAGIVFGLAFLARGDAALLAGLAGLAVIWQRRQVPWALGFGFILALTPWFIYAFITFGSPLPATLGVKRAHRALGAWPHIALGFWRWFGMTGLLFRIRFLLTILISLVGLPWFFFRKEIWALMIIAWGIVYAFAYMILNVPFYFWYATPLFVSMTLGAGMVMGALWGRFSGWWAKDERASLDASAIMAAGVTVLLFSIVISASLYSSSKSATRKSSIFSPRYEAYLRTSDWLRMNTPPDSTVAYIEVGIIGYYSQRHILDLLGLVTPGAESYIASHDLAGLFQKWRPDYYLRNRDIDNWGINIQVYDSSFFKTHYIPVVAIPQAGTEPIVIYQRKAPKNGAPGG